MYHFSADLWTNLITKKGRQVTNKLPHGQSCDFLEVIFIIVFINICTVHTNATSSEKSMYFYL